VGESPAPLYFLLIKTNQLYNFLPLPDINYMKEVLYLLAFGLANTFYVQASAAAAAADFPVMWVPAANGTVPANAIIGGNETGRTLPVCRARFNNGVHPGKVVDKNCNFGYGGKEVLAPQYDVLVGNPAVLKQSPQLVRWIAAQGGQVPPGAFFGAYEPGRPILPICQAPHHGGVHVGKVVGSNCTFGYGGREVLSPQYAVLVVGKNPVVSATGTNPVAIASAQNQALESTKAAVNAEVRNLAAPPGYISQIDIQGMDIETAKMAVQSNRASLLDAQLVNQMQAVQAKNNAITALNTQLGELRAAKLKTTDQATLANFDDQIKVVTSQIAGACKTQKMDMLQLQTLSNKRSEAFEMMTNFAKKLQGSRVIDFETACFG
jgi:hypothetical protein